MTKTLRLLLSLLLTLCLFSFSSPARAVGTFYVATDGSDSASGGTSGAPWKTISYALQHVPDGSLVLVRAGTYTGAVALRGNFASGVTVKSETPYQARLRNNGQALTATGGVSGITLDGFDIAHSGAGAGPLVIHINGKGQVGLLHDITLRNNVLHDSYNSDILKIDSCASRVTIEGNIFYNQSGSDEHIDVNGAQDIVIRHNIFFNNFAGSGRANNNESSNYIVIKDSGGANDALTGSRNVTVSGNVFLNWQGLPSSAFVMVGEDGTPTFEAQNVLVENNLMLGNSANNMRAPFAVWGSKDVTFRNNTVSGDLPAYAYAMLLSKALSNPSNVNMRFYNNIWSDPTGSMGAMSGATHNDFSDTPPERTTSFTLDHNVYWNNGKAIPTDAADKVNYTDDAHRVVGNPGLPGLGSISLPRWDSSSGKFGDGSSSIRAAFERLVERYGVISATGAAAGAADPANAPSEDILGQKRGARVDAGAYQSAAGIALGGLGRPGTARLTWRYSGSLPGTATWTIGYSSSAGSNPAAAVGLPAAARAYQLKGLSNYVRYTCTVTSVAADGSALFSGETQVMPTDIFAFVPLTRAP